MEASGANRFRRAVASAVSLLLVLVLVGPAPMAAAQAKVLKPDLTYAGVTEGDQAGYQVEAGDLDGDGVDDLIVGAWQEDGGGNQAGAVYILYGPLPRKKSLAEADAKLMAPRPGDYVGEGPIGIADMNGDGRDEMLIGAPGSFYALQPGSPGKIGETYLVYGSKKRLRGERLLPDVSDAVFTGIHMTEWLGFGSGGLGDLDSDGYEDVLIGAPATVAFSGVGYLFYGTKKKFSGNVAVTAADATIIGGKPGEMFAYESHGGDIDGDGASDLLISARPLAGEPGSLHVFYGGRRMSSVVPAEAADARVLFPSVDFFEGVSMDASADVTGDGIADIAIGDSSSINGELAHHGYVVAGGARLPARSLIASVAYASISGAGASVSLGDFNGDRRGDVIFGSPWLGEGDSASVLLGPIAEGRLTTDDIDVTLQGDAGSGAGLALASGRFDRDRDDDVIVGAPTGAGRVHAFFGRKLR